MLTRIFAVAGLMAWCAGAAAFDLGDLDVAKKALAIGSKALDANKEVEEPEEIRIGRGVGAQLLGAAPPVQNDAAQRYVNQVGMWLAQQAERPDLPWTFAIVASDDVNAFSTPGGNVFITRGLYARLRNEAELAGVLAHEIGHVLRKHQLASIRKQLGREWQMEVVSAVASDQDAENAEHYTKAFGAGTEVFARGLDKREEFEADRLGVVIAARAGYNPYGLVSVLQTLGRISAKDSAVALLFKTHPAPGPRLDALAAAMGDRLDRYADGVDQTRRFVPLKMEAASDAARKARK